MLHSTPRLRAIAIAEADGQRSRANVSVVQTGAALQSGTLLTQTGDAGAAAFAMIGTGNPTAGPIGVGGLALPGVYYGTFTSSTRFQLEDPLGVPVGVGTLGVAFNKGGIGFTLTAGTVAPALGSEFTLTVAPGDQTYSAYDGSGPASAILYNFLGPKTGITRATAYVRDAELNRFELIGLDANAVADLSTKGLVIRGREIISESGEVTYMDGDYVEFGYVE